MFGCEILGSDLVTLGHEANFATERQEKEFIEGFWTTERDSFTSS